MTLKYVILRCCRDWPIQIDAIYHRGGTCGLCGQSPKLVLEEYKRGDTALTESRFSQTKEQ